MLSLESSMVINILLLHSYDYYYRHKIHEKVKIFSQYVSGLKSKMALLSQTFSV